MRSIVVIVFFSILFSCAAKKKYTPLPTEVTPNSKILTPQDEPIPPRLLSEITPLAENDCTASWYADLSVQHLQPKYFSGDTNSAYAIFAYEHTNRNPYMFKIQGTIPDARFMSIETYSGKLQQKVDHIFDYTLGGFQSLNPAKSASGKAYEIMVHPEDQRENATYKLKIPSKRIGAELVTIMYRLYSPSNNQNLTPADLPRVFSYDPETKQPKKCPEIYRFNPVDIPQTFVTLIRQNLIPRRKFTFEPPPHWFTFFGLGANSAIPSYVMQTNKTETAGEVTVLRFKAPRYTSQSSPEVRYWSMCFQNFGKNTTLSCLPDHVARIDQQGFVTIVFGTQEAQLLQRVHDLGFNFIPDNRERSTKLREDQKVVGFAYRNLMPNNTFAQNNMYKKDYLPKGVVCSISDFMSNEKIGSCLPK